MTPSEVQPFCRMVAQDLGAHHVEGHVRRVDVGEGDDAVASPSAAARARRPRARPRPGRPRAAARRGRRPSAAGRQRRARARRLAALFLGFLDGGLDAFHAVSSLCCRSGRRPGPAAGRLPGSASGRQVGVLDRPELAPEQVERQVVGVQREQPRRDRHRDQHQRRHHQPSASSGSRAGCGCRAPWRRAGCRAWRRDPPAGGSSGSASPSAPRSRGRRRCRRPRRRRRSAAGSGCTGQPGMVGCSISEKRSPLDSTSMRSPTWAWPRLATAALYCVAAALSRSRSSPASTISLAGVAWIEASSSASVCFDHRLLLGDELQPLVDRRQLDVELAQAAPPPAPSASGSARAACCSADQPLERRDAGLAAPGCVGLPGL